MVYSTVYRFICHDPHAGLLPLAKLTNAFSPFCIGDHVRQDVNFKDIPVDGLSFQNHGPPLPFEVIGQSLLLHERI